MIINLYSIAFIISLILLCFLVSIGESQKLIYYSLVYVTITLNCFGYYLLSTSETLEVALTAQKVIYLSGVFIPVFILFGTMKLCHINIPRWFSMPLVIYEIITLNFTLMIGHNDVYYKNVQLAQEDGLSYLTKDYGPTHSLYIISLFGCTILAFVLLIYTIIKKKDVSYKTALSLIFCEILVVVCYVYRRVTGSHIEWFVVAYLLDELIVLSLVNNLRMYQVSESVADSLDRNTSSGYVVFDIKGKYTVCNEIARKYLPELKYQRADTLLSEEKTPTLYRLFRKHFIGVLDKTYEYIIDCNGRILKCSIKNLFDDKHKNIVGYLIEITDDTKQQEYLRLMNNYNDQLETETKRQTEQIRMMHNRMILNMADMVESRDLSTGGHIKRTSDVVKIFIDKLKSISTGYILSDIFLENVIKAAPMHDLGKIGIDDRILRKPGKFTDEEYAEMKTHSEKGAKIILQVLDGVENEEFIRVAKNVAYYHHEKWNGTGYPTNLAGEDIPLEARIMALADVFDALVSKRCYKTAMDYDQAFNIIEESLGQHFDPNLGLIFLSCREELEEYYNNAK